MRLNFRVDSGRLFDTLRGMDEFASAPRAALVEVAAVRQRQQSVWIKSQAAYVPLKPASAARKARRGRSTRPLAGGALERSLSSGGKYSVRRINKQSVVVGTRDPVAHLHQSGARRGKRGGTLPVRKVINVTPENAAEFRQVFADGIMSIVAGNARARRFAA